MPGGSGRYSGLLPVTLALSIASTSSDGSHPVCKPGVEFWSTGKISCLPCTVCEPKFTLSPCAVHQDAICGPLSALKLDWPFLSTGKPSGSKMTHETEIEDFKDDFDWRRRWDKETYLELDWQIGALILAACASLVFLITVAYSAFIYARQWRRMKKNFTSAGHEEFSTKLNLMMKAELAEIAGGAPMSPGDPEMRCQYLEQLLDWKRDSPMVAGWPEAGSNVYIEEGETLASRNTQLARIQRNIENILNNKPRQER